MSAQTRKLDERHQKTLRELLKKDENKKCFDCPQKGPGYANLFCNSFVCVRCSGLLREYGHRLKSIGASSFTPAEIKALEDGGNAVAARIWLVSAPAQAEPSDDTSAVKESMKVKYQQKKYYKEPTSQPPKVETTAAPVQNIAPVPKSPYSPTDTFGDFQALAPASPSATVDLFEQNSDLAGNNQNNFAFQPNSFNPYSNGFEGAQASGPTPYGQPPSNNVFGTDQRFTFSSPVGQSSASFGQTFGIQPQAAFAHTQPFLQVAAQAPIPFNPLGSAANDDPYFALREIQPEATQNTKAYIPALNPATLQKPRSFGSNLNLSGGFHQTPNQSISNPFVQVHSNSNAFGTAPLMTVNPFAQQVQAVAPALNPFGAPQQQQQQQFQQDSYPQQAFAQQGFPQQGFPQQGFPQQGFPQQGFAQQGFAQQGLTSAIAPNPFEVQSTATAALNPFSIQQAGPFQSASPATFGQLLQGQPQQAMFAHTSTNPIHQQGAPATANTFSGFKIQPALSNPFSSFTTANSTANNSINEYASRSAYQTQQQQQQNAAGQSSIFQPQSQQSIQPVNPFSNPKPKTRDAFADLVRPTA